MGLLLLARAVRTDDTRLVDNGDAYVDRADDGSWTLGNPGIAFTLTLTHDHALVPSSLTEPGTGDEWLAGTVAEPGPSIAGGTRTLNGEGFVFDGVTTARTRAASNSSRDTNRQIYTSPSNAITSAIPARRSSNPGRRLRRPMLTA